MDRVRTRADRREALALHCRAGPPDLQALADACEALTHGEQYEGFEKVLPVLLGRGLGPASDEDEPTGEGANDDLLHVGLLADSGAYESAALAMLPEKATFTGGRLADGGYVAQVVLPSGAGAHSRNARSLAMAWLAALLRAVAREMVEQKIR